MKKFVKETILSQSKDRFDFYNRLHRTGLHIYTKNGIPIGVKDGRDGRKYSFSSMGITPEDMRILDQKGELNKIRDRLSRLEQIRNKDIPRQKGLDRE